MTWVGFLTLRQLLPCHGKNPPYLALFPPGLQLFLEVKNLGGFERVSEGKLWRRISRTFGIPSECTAASTLLRTAYEKIFGEWEQQREGLLLAAAAGDRLAAAATGYSGPSGTTAAVVSNTVLNTSVVPQQYPSPMQRPRGSGTETLIVQVREMHPR